MTVKKTDKAGEPEKGGCLFSKEQLLAAERFRGRQDILNALLAEGGQYTVVDVEQRISDYMKGRVK